jgi:hypothetical protein
MDPSHVETVYLDSQVPKLPNHVRKPCLLERPWVVVASDPGEGMGEHGQRTHSSLVHDSTLHLRLILAAAATGAGWKSFG